MKLQYFAMSALAIILAGPLSGPASADTVGVGSRVTPIPDKPQLAISSQADGQAVAENSSVQPTTLNPNVTNTGNPRRATDFLHVGGGIGGHGSGGHGH